MLTAKGSGKAAVEHYNNILAASEIVKTDIFSILVG
jgi:hypothetical protein